MFRIPNFGNFLSFIFSPKTAGKKLFIKNPFHCWKFEMYYTGKQSDIYLCTWSNKTVEIIAVTSKLFSIVTERASFSPVLQITKSLISVRQKNKTNDRH